MILTEQDLFALDAMGDALRAADLELFSWDELDHQRAENDCRWCMACLIRRQIDGQFETLIRRFEREIMSRLDMPFDQFKEDIPIYVRALVIGEVGYRYPFVFRGSEEYMYEFSKIHIRYMTEQVYSTWQPEQKSVLLASLWAQEYTALVHRKDVANDWEFGWEGWNEPHDGGVCPRCEAHGRVTHRCMFCGICHTCFATYAEIRHQIILERRSEDQCKPSKREN